MKVLFNVSILLVLSWARADVPSNRYLPPEGGPSGGEGPPQSTSYGPPPSGNPFEGSDGGSSRSTSDGGFGEEESGDGRNEGERRNDGNLPDLGLTSGGGQKYNPSQQTPSEPAKYEFNYDVSDAATGTVFGHQESRDGNRAEGTYNVLLPDGRKQIVVYQADSRGYKPKIMYEGGERGSQIGASKQLDKGEDNLEYRGEDRNGSSKSLENLSVNGNQEDGRRNDIRQNVMHQSDQERRGGFGGADETGQGEGFERNGAGYFSRDQDSSGRSDDGGGSTTLTGDDRARFNSMSDGYLSGKPVSEGFNSFQGTNTNSENDRTRADIAKGYPSGRPFSEISLNGESGNEIGYPSRITDSLDSNVRGNNGYSSSKKHSASGKNGNGLPEGTSNESLRKSDDFRYQSSRNEAGYHSGKPSTNENGRTVSLRGKINNYGFNDDAGEFGYSSQNSLVGFGNGISSFATTKSNTGYSNGKKNEMRGSGDNFYEKEVANTPQLSDGSREKGNQQSRNSVLRNGYPSGRQSIIGHQGSAEYGNSGTLSDENTNSDLENNGYSSRRPLNSPFLEGSANGYSKTTNGRNGISNEQRLFSKAEYQPQSSIDSGNNIDGSIGYSSERPLNVNAKTFSTESKSLEGYSSGRPLFTSARKPFTDGTSPIQANGLEGFSGGSDHGFHQGEISVPKSGEYSSSGTLGGVDRSVFTGMNNNNGYFSVKPSDGNKINNFGGNGSFVGYDSSPKSMGYPSGSPELSGNPNSNAMRFNEGNGFSSRSYEGGSELDRGYPSATSSLTSGANSRGGNSNYKNIDNEMGYPSSRPNNGVREINEIGKPSSPMEKRFDAGRNAQANFAYPSQKTLVGKTNDYNEFEGTDQRNGYSSGHPSNLNGYSYDNPFGGDDQKNKNGIKEGSGYSGTSQKNNGITYTGNGNSVINPPGISTAAEGISSTDGTAGYTFAKSTKPNGSGSRSYGSSESLGYQNEAPLGKDNSQSNIGDSYTDNGYPSGIGGTNGPDNAPGKPSRERNDDYQSNNRHSLNGSFPSGARFDSKVSNNGNGKNLQGTASRNGYSYGKPAGIQENNLNRNEYNSPSKSSVNGRTMDQGYNSGVTQSEMGYSRKGISLANEAYFPGMYSSHSSNGNSHFKSNDKNSSKNESGYPGPKSQSNFNGKSGQRHFEDGYQY